MCLSFTDALLLKWVFYMSLVSIVSVRCPERLIDVMLGWGRKGCGSFCILLGPSRSVPGSGKWSAAES